MTSSCFVVVRAFLSASAAGRRRTSGLWVMRDLSTFIQPGSSHSHSALSFLAADIMCLDVRGSAFTTGAWGTINKSTSTFCIFENNAEVQASSVYVQSGLDERFFLQVLYFSIFSELSTRDRGKRLRLCDIVKMKWDNKLKDFVAH